MPQRFGGIALFSFSFSLQPFKVRQRAKYLHKHSLRALPEPVKRKSKAFRVTLPVGDNKLNTANR
ncbi:hypothetical protein M2132_000888 [Dysgonomonas sp. PH5-45]|uniref:hypothetical protein n=1 Tax=unclassified Dysgonomonas TaxID=2630389 RepID=UPI002476EA4F|nr:MULTISPECIES: hypothetical protein [unclassified Dysgonomonas]MDH6354560.1 hypothetical protein [Dysgonomonas sp. PH5-45]MDH6387384.1 hypothetical protein [Dysgonomonas sp. PH5-37]